MSEDWLIAALKVEKDPVVKRLYKQQLIALRSAYVNDAEAGICKCYAGKKRVVHA